MVRVVLNLIYIYVYPTTIPYCKQKFWIFNHILVFEIKLDTFLDQHYFSYLEPIQLLREIFQNICDLGDHSDVVR